MRSKEITVLEKEIHINKDDYFSLTDIAKYKNPEAPADVVKNWLRRCNANRIHNATLLCHQKSRKITVFRDFFLRF